MDTTLNIKIIAGNSHPRLADGISKLLKVPITPCICSKFSDGEIRVEIKEKVRNSHMFIIQTGYSNKNSNYNTNDYLMELLILVDACKRSAVRSINVIMPYCMYSRQDKKDESRAPITAKLMARMLENSGVNRIVFMDLHSSQIQGFFEIPADNIYSAIIYNDYFNKTLFKNLTTEERNKFFIVISPDAGATKRTLKFAKMMKLDMALMHKERIGPNQVENCLLYTSPSPRD